MLIQSIEGCCNEFDETAPSEIERKWDFGIGLGYGHSSNPFIGSDDIPSYVSLDFSYYGEKFFFDNGELGFTLVDKPNFGFNIIGTFNSERIYYSYLNDLGLNANNSNNAISISSTDPLSAINADTVVTPIPDAYIVPSPAPPSVTLFPPGDFIVSFELPKKDFSYQLGIEFIYDHPIGSFNFQLTKDVIATHSGNDALLKYSNGMQFKRWSFATEIGAHWKSKKLINYYYGVDYRIDSIFDITELNLFYEGNSGTDILFGLTTNYRINNNLSVVGSYRYNQFSSSISNSPIIDSNHKQNIFVGLFYRF